MGGVRESGGRQLKLWRKTLWIPSSPIQLRISSRARAYRGPSDMHGWGTCDIASQRNTAVLASEDCKDCM